MQLNCDILKDESMTAASCKRKLLDTSLQDSTRCKSVFIHVVDASVEDLRIFLEHMVHTCVVMFVSQDKICCDVVAYGASSILSSDVLSLV